jgi:hypothetical protein
MADQIQSFKLICSGGLNSNENHLDLSDNDPGAATRLVNYEPSLYGGYRRIEGYAEFDGDYGEVTVDGAATGEGEVLGLAIFKDDVSNSTKIIAARQDAGGANYSFYYHTAYIGWRKYTLDHSVVRPMSLNGLTVTKLRHAVFNFGTGNKIIFVDGVNPAILFDGSHAEELRSGNTGGYTAGGAHNSAAPTGGGNQCLNAPALIDVFENHIFMSGHEANRAVVAHSAPNDPYTWTSAAGAGQLAIGFDVVQIKPFRDDLFIFGNNGIKKINVNTSNEFALTQVTANVGCVARDSVLEIGGDLIFLAPDGLRPCAGTSRIGDIELETVSKPIQAILVDIIKNQDMSKLNGVVLRSKSQIRYFIGADDVTVGDSIGLIGGLTNNSGSIDWEFGELLGIRASCCASGYIGPSEYVLHGDYDGRVYQQETGKNFNGDDIVSIYATPYLDFGETEQRKVMRKVNTFIRGEGPFEMLLSVTYDWGDGQALVPSTYSQASDGAPTRYGGRTIDYNGANVLYGGSSKPVMTSDIQGSGFSVQATFVSVGQTEPFSIQGMVFEFSTAGRR